MSQHGTVKLRIFTVALLFSRCATSVHCKSNLCDVVSDPSVSLSFLTKRHVITLNLMHLESIYLYAFPV